ncbi:hypothetical protein SO802_029674 [Lithocarpus litseifolius]|uniref:SWIM-type domain-containing protein n=1 Tax=Lithocarpus litseifolius TaxID=425828 RepID=A0AAW2BTR3_9ROSI
MPGMDQELADFHLIVVYSDAMYLTELVRGHHDIHVYVEHPIHDPILVDEGQDAGGEGVQPLALEQDYTSYYDNDDGSEHDDHDGDDFYSFYDSDDMYANDQIFNNEDEVDVNADVPTKVAASQVGSRRVGLSTHLRDFVEDSSDSWDGKDDADVNEPGQMGAGVMNSNYESEELHSLVESSSDDELGYDSDDKFEGDNSTHVHTFHDGDLAAGMDLVCGVPYFERLYICLEGCKKGFLAGCRSFIGLDACHLKNKSGGQLITAVCRDPSEEYFPLAYAVVEAESKDSWTWFINLLLADIGVVQTFIDNWPQYEHRICCRHLYNNFKKNHPGVLIRELFWKAAKATYKEEFDRVMDELKGIDANAHSWLDAHLTTKWAKHIFSEDALTDTIVNNMCESFNSRILKFRSKPIISMLECIRLYPMTRFQDNREKILRVESDICAKVLKKLHKEKVATSRWLACWAGQTQFEVENGLQSFTVDLATAHCSCRKWDISGIPCAHAITYIFFNRQDAEQYVHPCYHVSTDKACYEPIISPINGQNMWRPSCVTLVLPPIKRRPHGRPKKKRAREPNEPTSRRAGISKQCKACGKLGHNRRNCKGEIGRNSSLPGTTNRTNTSKKSSMHSPSTPSAPYLSSKPSFRPGASHQSGSTTQNLGAHQNSSSSNPNPRQKNTRVVTSETLKASKNASRYMKAIRHGGSQSSVHGPRK